MQHAIHWDYADSFTGRDAAYLIAGLDPSSHSAEDAFRVQAIVQKLKDAYYLGCAELRHDLNSCGDASEQGDLFGGPHLHKYRKDELLSVRMEELISGFMKSDFVAKGHLAELEGFNRHGAKFNSKHRFPEAEALKNAEQALESARTTQNQHWKNCCPDMYAELQDLERQIIEAVEKEEKRAITWNQYYVERMELESKSGVLCDAMHKQSTAVDPEVAATVGRAGAEWRELSKREDDWNDRKRGEDQAYEASITHLIDSAYVDLSKWSSAYIHEFSTQLFSRRELCRWLSDNNYPTAYSFASKQSVDETPVAGKERTNYLNLIGSLVDLYWKSAYPGAAYSQTKLLADLEKYSDFPGMRDRNLKEKLSKATKSIGVS